MSGTYVFALKEDWVPVLEEVARRRPLRCTPLEHFPSPTFPSFLLDSGLPNLGRATDSNYIFSQSFLVHPEDTVIRSRRIHPKGAPACFPIDQELNEDTVILAPGGIFQEGVVVGGGVSTIWKTPTALELMKWFRAAIRRRFVTINGTRVGAGAADLLAKGWRLAMNATSPPEYDLRAEQGRSEPHRGEARPSHGS